MKPLMKNAIIEEKPLYLEDKEAWKSDPILGSIKSLWFMFGGLKPAYGMPGEVDEYVEPFVNSVFKLIEPAVLVHPKLGKEYEGYKTKGTLNSISLNRLTSAGWDMKSFDSPNAYKSFDYDELSSDAIIEFPTDKLSAKRFIDKNLIGKFIRIVAKSDPSLTRFKQSHYLFVIQDMTNIYNQARELEFKMDLD